jgi:hypothetical protein
MVNHFVSPGDQCKQSFLTPNNSKTANLDKWKFFHLSPPCPFFLRLAGGPLLKRPHGGFRSDPPCGPCGQEACACFLPLWLPHTERLCPCYHLPSLPRMATPKGCYRQFSFTKKVAQNQQNLKQRVKDLFS